MFLSSITVYCYTMITVIVLLKAFNEYCFNEQLIKRLSFIGGNKLSSISRPHNRLKERTRGFPWRPSSLTLYLGHVRIESRLEIISESFVKGFTSMSSTGVYHSVSWKLILLWNRNWTWRKMCYLSRPLSLGICGWQNIGWNIIWRIWYV